MRIAGSRRRILHGCRYAYSSTCPTVMHIAELSAGQYSPELTMEIVIMRGRSSVGNEVHAAKMDGVYNERIELDVRLGKRCVVGN